MAKKLDKRSLACYLEDSIADLIAPEKSGEGGRSAMPTQVEKLFDIRIKGKWLSTVEAADYLGITPKALYLRVHRGQVKAWKLGATLKFRPEDLEASLKQREV